jgi:hypothetical protein
MGRAAQANVSEPDCAYSFGWTSLSPASAKAIGFTKPSFRRNGTESIEI